MNSNAISWASAGTLGFKGSKKSTPFAAGMAAEAAGKAAALAVRDKKELRDLDVKELQSALREEGVWFRD